LFAIAMRLGGGLRDKQVEQGSWPDRICSQPVIAAATVAVAASTSTRVGSLRSARGPAARGGFLIGEDTLVIGRTSTTSSKMPGMGGLAMGVVTFANASD
tara:strand:+ start:306 stop:605 length:300 start_codon:yes stop_codon:yes gene_type:complete